MTEDEEPDLGARHLLLCREVVWNAADDGGRYNLLGLLTVLRPKGSFPIVWGQPIYAFVQFFGSPGKFDIWIELVRLIQADDGEVIDEAEEVLFGPFEIDLDDRFMHGRTFPLRGVPFDEPGLYEFRVRAGGVYDVLAAERILVEG
jgi:hypothetical protein